MRRIALTALIAGSAAGLVATTYQSIEILPLIAEAESYEHLDSAAHEHAHRDAHGDAHAHERADGLEETAQNVASHEEQTFDAGHTRFLLTGFANVLAGIGFALILCAGATLCGPIDWRNGLLWGLAGYAAFSLAPALGLPPLLPGMAAADVVERQLWWGFAAAATAGGLACMAFASKWGLKAFGAVLIVVPHAIGAPVPLPEATSSVPAELAAAFTSAALIGSLLFWLTIGGFSGLILGRSAASEGPSG